MAYALRTDVPARHPPPRARHRVSFTLDEEALRLSRECAADRGESLSTWLARAARYHCGIDEHLRECEAIRAELGPPATEEEIRRIDEKLEREEGIPPIIEYAPTGPVHRVSTMLDEKLLGRVRENARHAGLTVSAWLARSAWYHTQVDPRWLWREQHASGRLVPASEDW
jgi:hypothetical protein